MSDSTPTNTTELRAGALHLSSVLMQGITLVAPATAILLTLQFTAQNAGVAAPLAYLAEFVIVLILGVTLAQLAKHMPSAGGYYTYIGRTIHPRAGWLTGWMFFLYDPTVAGFSLAFMGYLLQQALKDNYGIHFPWWLFVLIAGAFVIYVGYRGIKLSARILATLGIAEIGIVLLLSAWSLVHPGRGGVNISSYVPTHAPSFQGLALGIVFSIFALTGWEGVAPLAEECERPKENVPKALIGAILIMGAYLVFCSWALLVGWGTNHMASFESQAGNPVLILARRYWRPAWVLMLLALLNSMIAVSIAANNVSTRMWYAMARAGSLPRLLAKIHPSHKTPVNAIWLQAFLMYALGLGLGLWIGPENEFGMMGLVLTFSLILIYGLGNVGVFRFYFRERRHEFNPLLHGLLPVLGTVALLAVGYYSLRPWPAPPSGYAPWVVVVWLVIGLVLLVVSKATGNADWIEETTQMAPAPEEVPTTTP